MKKNPKQDSTAPSISGSVNKATLSGDYYVIGMSLTNIFNSILATYGLDMGGKMIEEALKISATSLLQD